MIDICQVLNSFQKPVFKGTLAITTEGLASILNIISLEFFQSENNIKSTKPFKKLKKDHPNIYSELNNLLFFKIYNNKKTYHEYGYNTEQYKFIFKEEDIAVNDNDIDYSYFINDFGTENLCASKDIYLQSIFKFIMVFDFSELYENVNFTKVKNISLRDYDNDRDITVSMEDVMSDYYLYQKENP